MNVLKKIKKKLLKIYFLIFILTISFLIYFSKIASAIALEISWPKNPFGTDLTDESGLTGLVKYFYEWIVFLGGIATFVALIIGGIRYMTSAGNPSALTDAKEIITSAFIGLALLLGSWLILRTINPELVISNVPILTLDPSQFEGIATSSLNLVRCAKAIIYDQTNYGGNSVSIDVEHQGSFNFQPKSVKVVDSGGTPCENATPTCGCTVYFYSTSAGGNCSGSIQYAASPQSNPDLTDISLPDLRCAEVKPVELR